MTTIIPISSQTPAPNRPASTPEIQPSAPVIAPNTRSTITIQNPNVSAFEKYSEQGLIFAGEVLKIFISNLVDGCQIWFHMLFVQSYESLLKQIRNGNTYYQRMLNSLTENLTPEERRQFKEKIQSEDKLTLFYRELALRSVLDVIMDESRFLPQNSEGQIPLFLRDYAPRLSALKTAYTALPSSDTLEVRNYIQQHQPIQSQQARFVIARISRLTKEIEGNWLCNYCMRAAIKNVLKRL